MKESLQIFAESSVHWLPAPILQPHCSYRDSNPQSWSSWLLGRQ